MLQLGRKIISLAPVAIVFACFALIYFKITIYFLGDLVPFEIWAKALRENFREIYIREASCDYPLLGVLLSAGPIAWLHAHFDGTWDGLTRLEELYRIHRIFRAYLVIWDLGAAFLVYRLAVQLKVRQPLWLAAWIVILPSSWVGSSLWCQIDGVTQVFILLSLTLMIAATTRPWLLPLCSAAISAGILTKVLFWFQLPTLTIGFCASAFTVIQNRLKHGKEWAAFSVVLACLLLNAPSLFVDTPQPYLLHLQYVLLGTIRQDSHFAVLGGGNLWTLLGWQLNESADGLLPFLGISPRALAFILFSSALVIVHLPLKHLFRTSRDMFWIGIVFVLALTNLLFNIFLTGTHERYLFHFYPYVIVAVVALQARAGRPPWIWLAGLSLTATLYGAYVFSSLYKQMAGLNYFPFEPAIEAFIQVALLLCLLCQKIGRAYWLRPQA